MLVLVISVLMIDAGTALAEYGPFENFFHKLRRAFSEPQHKSVHRSSHKQTEETKSSPSEESNTRTATGDVSAPPSEHNTRSATRATGKQQNGLAYGKTVPGKTGLGTSPYSPDGG